MEDIIELKTTIEDCFPFSEFRPYQQKIFPVIFPIIFINPFFIFSWVFIFLFNLIWFFCEGDERYPEERHLGG